MFWPTSTCQILIKFSFLESLWHKETDCTSFANFCKQPVKGNLHIFSVSWLKIRIFKILQIVLHIWNCMVKGFSEMYNFSFFWQIFFCKHFYYITGFCDKKINFCKFAIFFANSKSKFSMMYHLSYLDISWFSSTPAGIGLRVAYIRLTI